MARKPLAETASWPSLTLEGHLIAPAMASTISQAQAQEQSAESYGVRKGLTLREELSLAFRVGQAHYDAFARLASPSLAATRHFIGGLLTEAFGFHDLQPGAESVAFVAGGRAPIVAAPPSDEKLDRKSVALSTPERGLSPALALQDRLNAEEGALWGLVTNGRLLRLTREDASLTRPAYIEADLTQIFANEDAASFALLWLLIHRSRFGAAGAPAADCALERWREAGAREGEAARDRLASQVREALRLLGSGFLEANPTLAARLASGEVDLTDWFNELLRLVYRLIFLMAAEDRDLLHPAEASASARALYAEGYSLGALRKRSSRAAAWDRHPDRYEGVKIVFDALAHGEERLGLPALGGLFAPDQLPRLAGAKLRNRAFLEAIYRLSWLRESSGMVPVNWRAMRTEELGSVYESLLELQPQLGPDGQSLLFASEAAEQKGNQRKTTGSYYTPDSLVESLLDTALNPVLERTEGEEILKLSIIDPACGSGHFLLAAARRMAMRLARWRSDGAPTPAEHRHALREVARHCIYGVDRNPMAVELTKVALWIDTVDPGFPLGFFDAQIRCGDALLGVFDLKVLESGVPDAAYKALTGDDKETAKAYLKADRKFREIGQGDLDFHGEADNQRPSLKLAPLALDFSEFQALPENDVAQIQAKSARFQSLRASAQFLRVQQAADLHVAAFLLPKTGPAPADASLRSIPTSEEVWRALNGHEIRPAMAAAPEAARRARAFHWPLEFPPVMQNGGFDVVIGNPPWERIKLQEQEFFAARSPAIAKASNKAARERLIKALAEAPAGSSEQALFAAFVAARREAEATSEFVRLNAQDGGRFALTGQGDVNTYALFAELFFNLARARAGIVAPTGIATDATTAPFFAHLVETRRLARLVDFENRAGLFPAVDSRMKFCLLTLGQLEPEAHFAFFLTDPAQMSDQERNFTLSPASIARLNPNTRTAPIFRSRADAELTAKIYARVPVLIEDAKGAAGNPWELNFHTRIWHMAEDAEWFRTAQKLTQDGFTQKGTDWTKPDASAPDEQGEKLAAEAAFAGGPPLAEGDARVLRYVPLYEAKMIHQFDHRWASYDEAGETSADVSLTQKQNPDFEPLPRYWVPAKSVKTRLEDKKWTRGWLMGWRDIARATDERTVIASMFPFCAVGHTAPLMFPRTSTPATASLFGNFNSIVLDYCARQAVGGTHLTYGYLKQLPILPPEFYTPARLEFTTPRVLELTYASHAMAPFARDLGCDGPPFPWDEDRRALLRAELDAFYARAYGLTREELRYVLDPADVKGADYPSETFRVLKERETRQYGEYRTRRLILAAWDRMEEEGEFQRLGLAAGEYS